jgi:hypothetical protein
MSKKFIVNNCWECPMREFINKFDSRCGLDDNERKIPDAEKIPEWCQLEDA